MCAKENEIALSKGVQLCLHCGLCCMGYFHPRAVINNSHDLFFAKKMGAKTVIDKNNQQLFDLPCPAFDGKCTCYPERPSVCENHQCELLKSVNTEQIDLDKAINISEKMKSLCVSLDQELMNLNIKTQTKCFTKRFKPLFASNKYINIRNQYPDLFLKYATYMVLKNRYFYHEGSDFMQDI